MVMSYTIQTERYRYTEWIKGNTGELVARDLFDHQLDPDENVNISHLPQNADLMDQLSGLLQRGKGWRDIQENIP
jgi:hypothetical protein